MVELDVETKQTDSEVAFLTMVVINIDSLINKLVDDKWQIITLMDDRGRVCCLTTLSSWMLSSDYICQHPLQ